MRIIHNNFGNREQVGIELTGRKAYLAFTQISRAEKKLKAFPGWLELEGNNKTILCSTLFGAEVLIFVVTFLLEKRYAPTYQEISEEIGIGRGAVFAQVESLLEHGLLKNDENAKFRRLRITEKTVEVWKSWFNIDLQKEVSEWIDLL
jgi:biotin operon repressor